MATAKPDLLQGTLDLLILKTLLLEPNHGWGISQRIQQLSQDVLAVNQGSLYPALARLEEQGLIAAEWGVSENNRRARFYSLTKLGRRQLETETAYCQRMSAAINRVVEAVEVMRGLSRVRFRLRAVFDRHELEQQLDEE